MKNLLLFAALCTYLIAALCSCASQQPVTGGPKDTIPPTLLSTTPKHKSLNFADKTISLVFSEPVKENQLNSKLIVTPDDQNKFKTTIRKSQVTLEFEKPFRDSTTYTLNFNSSIEDISEGNDAENVILAFSTTTYIDSLSINGVVTDLMTSKPLPDVTVALYVANDTTHIFNKRPLYFTKTSKEGNYSLENLKTGSYRLYAFEDKNKNNLCESNSEKHGFAADTLNLTSNIDSLNIAILLNDVKPLNQIAARTSGVYFESRYNKALQDYQLQPLADSARLQNWQIYSSLTEDLRGITFYPASNPRRDSLLVAIAATDSTNNTVTDSVYLKFEPSRRTKPKFSYVVTPPTESEITPVTNILFNFNKPLLSYNLDSIKIAIDSVFTFPLQVDSTYLNGRRTQLQLFVTLNTSLISNLKASLKAKQDTLAPDTTTAEFKSTQSLGQLLSKYKDNYTRIKLPKASFISVDKDTSAAQFLEYRFINPEEKGIVRAIVNTQATSYTVQLINKSYQAVKSISTSRNVEFKNVPPGDYTFRILLDQNNDGQWSPGNSLRWIQPEKVIVYPQFFNVRANWVMDNIEIDF